MKALYRVVTRGSRRGLMADFNGPGKVPAEATAAPPGSLAKMQVMRRRMLAGEGLHHPGDASDQEAGLVQPFLGLPIWESGTPTGLEGDDG